MSNGEGRVGVRIDPEAGGDDLRDEVSVDVDAALTGLRAAVVRGDGAEAALLVRQAWFDLLANGRMVRPLLEMLPDSELSDQPLLLAMLGVLYYGDAHGRPRALRLFGSAVRAARDKERSMDAIDRALLLVSEGAGHRLVGEPSAGVGPARAAVEALDSMDEQDRRAVPQLSRAYAQAGMTLFYGGEVECALDAFRKGLAETSETPPSPGFSNLAMLAGVHAWRGELPTASSYVELAKSGPWTDTQRSMYPGTFYRIAEAILLLERFDPDAAREHLDAMVHDPRTIEHWLPIALMRAMTRLVAGNPGAALTELDGAMSGRHAQAAEIRASMAPTRVLLHLAMSSRDAAATIARRDVRAGSQRHLSSAHVELALGRPGEALREVRLAARGHLSFRMLAEATAVEAAALLRLHASPRVAVVVERLGSLLRLTEQRLVLGLLAPRDLEAVRAALVQVGYSDLFDRVPVRSLLLQDDDAPVLTERELIVLRALMRTGSITRIASELVVSPNTVKTQLRSLYKKLGASRRDEALAIAVDRHLVTVDGGPGG